MKAVLAPAETRPLPRLPAEKCRAPHFSHPGPAPLSLAPPCDRADDDATRGIIPALLPLRATPPAAEGGRGLPVPVLAAAAGACFSLSPAAAGGGAAVGTATTPALTTSEVSSMFLRGARSCTEETFCAKPKVEMVSGMWVTAGFKAAIIRAFASPPSES